MEELFKENNQVISIVIIGILLLFLMGVALLLFFFLSRKKIIAKELEKKSLEIAHQKKLLQSIIVTQEKERKRIAQDLHDDISSKLNVINLNANLLKDGDLSKEEALKVTTGILNATEKTLESARKIAHDLLPPVLERFGLKDAIEELADSYSNSKKVTIKYTIQYTRDRLTSTKELHFFRIVQELINNSVRHGKATKCAINIKETLQSFTFNYLDDGVGFDTTNTNYQKGLGMKNIESRVALLEGNYKIKSAIGEGFSITINL